MSTLCMDLWTVLAASIRRAITAVIGRTAPKPTATACVATSVDEPTAGTDFDPRQLSRARLLSELLAPVPPVEPGELNQACDTGPPQALPAALEAAITRRLLAARELLCRDMLTDLQGRPVMDSPARLAEWLRLHCVGLDHEVFLVIYLDSQHRLITVEQLFRGTLTQVSVYPREGTCPRGCGVGPGPQPPQRRPGTQHGGSADHPAVEDQPGAHRRPGHRPLHRGR